MDRLRGWHLVVGVVEALDFFFFIGLALLGFEVAEAGEGEAALAVEEVIFSGEARHWSRW